MSRDLGTKNVTSQERSATVIRVTPARDTAQASLDAVRVVIQREVVVRDVDGAVMAVKLITPSFTFTYAELEASPAVAAYLAACGAASLLEIFGREAALYDALIVEHTERAAAAEAAAAAAAALASEEAAATDP